MTFSPTEYPSMFIPPHSISIPVYGHAVEAGEPQFPVYRAMYAELAASWVRRGFFDHQVHIFTGDPELQEAWVTLGFGRHTTSGVRPVSTPVDGTGSAEIEVRQSSTEDIDVVMSLSDTLMKFHSQSPMFWPFLDEPHAAAREHQLESLAEAGNAYFIAYEHGRPVAMQSYLVPGFRPAIVQRDRTVYLYEGVVEPAGRGRGVGTALLRHGMAWAREQGHEFCNLHFASGNPSGAPFWLAHGFVPVEYAMVRHIDERVAWANGWA
jgi:GNAT superfamily N-acetyltransferase